MGVSEMGRSFYIQTKETEDQTMATKKTAVIPEEEILAAATDENINEHALHQTETEPEPDRVLSAEGAPGDADLIDICQTDSESANPEGMPIEDAARNTPEAPVSQTGSGTELPGEFPAGSAESAMLCRSGGFRRRCGGFTGVISEYAGGHRGVFYCCPASVTGCREPDG